MFEMYLIDRLVAFYNLSIVFSGALAIFGTILWVIYLAYLTEIKLPKKVKNKFPISEFYAWKHYKFLRILAYIIGIAILYLLIAPSKEMFDVFIESLKETQ